MRSIHVAFFTALLAWCLFVGTHGARSLATTTTGAEYIPGANSNETDHIPVATDGPSTSSASFLSPSSGPSADAALENAPPAAVLYNAFDLVEWSSGENIGR